MPHILSEFASREILGGRPREIYTFARADKAFRHTTSSSLITLATWGDVVLTPPLEFTPGLMTRGELQRSNEVSGLSVSVKVARTMPVADALRESTSHPMLCGIHKLQAGGGAPVLIAYGDVSGVSLADGWVTFDIVSAERRFSEPFPGKLIETQCQWSTYSGPCGVDEAAFSFDTTITDIGRGQIEVAAVDAGSYDGYYDNGQLRFGTGPSAERVHVVFSEGLVFHIIGRLPTGVEVGDAVTLVAGDDKYLSTCRDKFNNVGRFTGFDLLPSEDPLQVGLVAQVQKS